MGKKVLAVVVALVAAQVLSGCYFLRELNWNKDIVPKGEDTTATVGLQPSGEPKSTSYFFMGATGKGVGFTLGRPVFDSKDVTGQKQKLIEDNSLGDAIGGNCDVFTPVRSVRGPGVPSELWRTDEEVHADTNKMVQAKLKAKRNSANEGGGFAGLIITGEWEDDGDGIPEDPETSDDEIMCTGESTTSFILRGSNPTR
jgi:hypothetical protein